MSEQQTDRETDEVAGVLRWRRREALAAGMSRIEAGLYADSEIRTEELRHLIELHCPPELLAKILL
jgi:hypothetical protein